MKEKLLIELPPSDAWGPLRNLGRFLLKLGGNLMGYEVELKWK